MTRSAKGIVFKTLIIILVAAVIGGGIGYFYHESNLMEQYYDAKINDLQNQLKDVTVEVFCANTALKAGTIIKENSLSRKVIMSEQSDYLTENDFGKVLLIDIDEGMAITKAMVSGNSVNTDLREVEYAWIDVSSNIEPYDYVDIRLLYPDGTDYIVVAKKQIRYLNETKMVCDLWNNEEEILLLDAASVDAYMYEGSKIYMTRYIYPSIQEASIVNYSPSEQTIELIQNNPNIINVASEYLSAENRKRNEDRLNKLMVEESKENLDDKGLHLGWDTNADEYAENILGSSRPIAGSELPKEFGGSLWE